MSEVDALWHDAKRMICREERERFREQFSRDIMVGPYDDGGVAAPGTEKGDGFAIFIGDWRIGWWATRAEACEEASKLEHCILEHRPTR